MDIDVIKEQICDVCHKMWQLGWVAANDGIVSAKLDDGTILATPTGMSKSFITHLINLSELTQRAMCLKRQKGFARQVKSKCI